MSSLVVSAVNETLCANGLHTFGRFAISPFRGGGDGGAGGSNATMSPHQSQKKCTSHAIVIYLVEMRLFVGNTCHLLVQANIFPTTFFGRCISISKIGPDSVEATQICQIFNSILCCGTRWSDAQTKKKKKRKKQK